MLFNPSSNISITAKTASAPTADLKFISIYNQIAMNLANVNTGSKIFVGDFDTTEETIVPAPVDNQQINVMSISIINDNDEINDVTILSKDTDSGLSTPIYSAKLHPYERLQYTHSDGFVVYDSNGNKKCCKFSYAITAQDNPGNVLTDLFTADDRCVIESIMINNTNEAAQWASISLAPGGAADDISQYIHYEHAISSKETHEHCCKLFLNKDDVIRIKGESSDVIFMINGYY